MSSWLSSLWSSPAPQQTTPQAPTRSTSSHPPPFTPTPPAAPEPSAPPASTSSLAPDDDKAFASWRTSLSEFTGLGLSSDEAASAKERKEWRSCEKIKQDAMTTDPQIVFMLKHLQVEGCPTTDASIHCTPCDESSAGGFSPNHGIILCQNRIFSRQHAIDTLSHELIHVYDTCKFDVDFNNLRHHACTEIRAANLSGDCSWMAEVKRGNWSMSNAQSRCVRRRAVLSVEMNPNCASREDAVKAVDDVWASCKADTRPFDQIFKL